MYNHTVALLKTLKIFQKSSLTFRIKLKFLRLSSKVHHVLMLALKSYSIFCHFPTRTILINSTEHFAYSSHRLLTVHRALCSIPSSKLNLTSTVKIFLNLIIMDSLYAPASRAFLFLM